jgi:hypothetical protein
MGFAIFRNNPTSASIQSFLESAIVNASAAPKYIICDKGQQFWYLRQGPAVLVRWVQGLV